MSSLAGGAGDALSYIKTWQEKSISEEPPRETGIVGRLLHACIQLYSLVLRHIKNGSQLTKDDQASLRSNSDMLRLWADGFDASTGELDRLLQQSEALQHLTLSLIVSIGNTLSQDLLQVLVSSQDEIDSVLQTCSYLEVLEEVKYYMSQKDDLDDFAFEETASQSNSSERRLGEILSDLRIMTESLNDLTPCIESPIKDLDPEDTAYVPTDRAVFQYYSELVRARFPDAESEVVHRLGEANWERSQRIRAQCAANAGLEDVGAESSKSRFHDSGIGTSLPTQTGYAATIASFTTSLADGSYAKLPPLPEEAKRGLPFTCDACGKSVRYRRNREWKKHIFQDLLPYVCVYTQCSRTTSTFLNRDAWIDHLGSAHQLAPHWDCQSCPLCLETMTDGRSAIAVHMGRHLEEIALAALPRGTDSETSSEAGSVTVESPQPSKSIDNYTDGPNVALHKSSEMLYHRTDSNASLQLYGAISGSPNSVADFEQVSWPMSSPASETNQEMPLDHPRISNHTSGTVSPDVQASDVTKHAKHKVVVYSESDSSDSHSQGSTNSCATQFRGLPMPCAYPGCQHTAKSPALLKKHMRGHSKPFLCRVFGCQRLEGFSSRNDLERHARSVHNILPEHRPTNGYVCAVPDCKDRAKVWPRRDNFKAHVRAVHARDDEDWVEELMRSSKQTITRDKMFEVDNPVSVDDGIPHEPLSAGLQDLTDDQAEFYSAGTTEELLTYSQHGESLVTDLASEQYGSVGGSRQEVHTVVTTPRPQTDYAASITSARSSVAEDWRATAPPSRNEAERKIRVSGNAYEVDEAGAERATWDALARRRIIEEHDAEVKRAQEAQRKAIEDHEREVAENKKKEKAAQEAAVAKWQKEQADKAAEEKAAWDAFLLKQKEEEVIKKRKQEEKDKAEYKDKLWYDLAKFGFTKNQIDAMAEQKKAEKLAAGQ